MIFIPIFLFPICLVLSFFTRKSRKVFLSVLTIGTLTFILALFLLLDAELNMRSARPAYTYAALATAFSSILSIGYGALWLFIPIQWWDRILPILIFAITYITAYILKASTIILHSTLWLGITYFIGTYLKYIFLKNIPQKEKTSR